MEYIKQNFENGQTLDAQNLNYIENGIVELAKESSKLSEEIADLKENGTCGGNGATTAQANSLWVIIQKSAFAQQLTDEEINEFKTTWGIDVVTIPCTGITLNKTTLSFADNTSQTLTATVEPSNTTDEVVWKSSNTSVATVTNGVVKPLSNGSCTITATCGSVSATCSVTVKIADEEQVTLSSISATYTGGNVVVGTSVNSLTGITVKAHYSDGSTATVTGYTLSGTIVEGSNTITVSYGGMTTTFMVTGVGETFRGLYPLKNGTKTFSSGLTVTVTNGYHVEINNPNMIYENYINLSDIFANADTGTSADNINNQGKKFTLNSGDTVNLSITNRQGVSDSSLELHKCDLRSTVNTNCLNAQNVTGTNGSTDMITEKVLGSAIDVGCLYYVFKAPGARNYSFDVSLIVNDEQYV